MNDADTLNRYQHTPGGPVVDRLTALLIVRSYGVGGNAIAADDQVVVHATGVSGTVIAVNHDTGQVTVQPEIGGQLTRPGYELVVTVPAHHEPVPDDHLEAMSIDQARAAMAVLGSDRGRYPQYGGGYFAEWVFARARRPVKNRGEVILVRGQRLLVNPHRRPDGCGASGVATTTAWITRTDGIARPGRSVLVESRHITVEPRDHAQVAADRDLR